MKKVKPRSRWKYFMLACSFLFVGMVTFSACKPGQAANSWPVSPTGVNTTPAWTAGQFGSIQLSIADGKIPYTWKVKEGSTLPEGFELAANGTLSGTPPLLPAGTSQKITPPFTIVVSDGNGQEKEIQLSLTIIQPTAPTTPTTLTTSATTARTTPATTSSSTLSSEVPSATIDSASCQYVGIDWSNMEGDKTYRYQVQASGTASGPVNTAIQVTVDLKAASTSWADGQVMVNAPSWTFADNTYMCRKRTAEDPSTIRWTLSQDITVNYGPNAGTEWPASGDVYIDARILTGNSGGGYGVSGRWSQPITVPGPP